MTRSGASKASSECPTNNGPVLVACSVKVRADVERTFELFTAHIEHWWPILDPAGSATRRKVLFEPRMRGRIYAVRTDGEIEEWATVIVCVAPRTVLLEWRLSAEFVVDPAAPRTGLELFFARERDGSSRVTLIHTHLERFGLENPAFTGEVTARWREMLEGFRNYADRDVACSGPRAETNTSNRPLPAGIY